MNEDGHVTRLWVITKGVKVFKSGISFSSMALTDPENHKFVYFLMLTKEPSESIALLHEDIKTCRDQGIRPGPLKSESRVS